MRELAPEFKREAVALLEGSGRPLTQVAAELGIQRSMRRHGIRALAGRRLRPCTTDSRHFLPVAPSSLVQRFISSAPGRIWLADITCIATGDGWLYLAAILDLATRKIVGWAMRDHMRTELTLAALLMATQRQRTAPGLIHHSDRGSQYAAGASGDVCRRACQPSRRAQLCDRDRYDHDSGNKNASRIGRLQG